jgi:hypothetical protein
MYLMLRTLVMDGHNSLNLTSLSLQYRFVNILYIWTQFLLLYPFWQEWTRLLTLCKEFLYIISFDLYTVSKRFFGANLHNLTVFTILLSGLNFYCWTCFNTNGHASKRLLSVLTCILYILLFLMQGKPISNFSR